MRKDKILIRVATAIRYVAVFVSSCLVNIAGSDIWHVDFGWRFVAMTFAAGWILGMPNPPAIKAASERIFENRPKDHRVDS